MSEQFDSIVGPGRYPLRARFVRNAVQAYRLGRGKDRLYLILKSLLRVPRRLTVNLTPDLDINLDLEDYLQRWFFCHYLSEELDFSLLSKVLQPDDHFVDVGANIGVVSLLASRAVGLNGRVYAIEALPETRHHLEANIKLNEVTNISVLSFALLDENKEVEFYPSRDGNIGGSSLASHGSKSEPVRVLGKKFDTLVDEKRIDRCDVLKMDIEGAEPIALRGMERLFATSKPRAVMIEVSDSLLEKFSFAPSDVMQFFASRGYEWFVARDQGLQKLTDLSVGGYNNFWAILPGKVDPGLFR